MGRVAGHQTRWSNAERTEDVSNTTSKKTCYIVWNKTRTEGFITDDYYNALFAAKGHSPRNGSSAVGETFRECYAEDGEALPMQEIELEADK